MVFHWVVSGWCQQGMAQSRACLRSLMGDLDVDRIRAFCCQDWAAILQMTGRVLRPVALTAAAWLELVALWHHILVKGDNRHLQAHQSRQLNHHGCDLPAAGWQACDPGWLHSAAQANAGSCTTAQLKPDMWPHSMAKPAKALRPP